MKQEEKILVDAYLQYKRIEEENKRLALDTLKELSALAPHKVGEIIKWTEYKQKNEGTMWRPKYVNLPPKERRAVLTRVEASVNRWSDGTICVYYDYEFRPITSDGGISKNCAYPKEYEWTGEIHKDYK